MRIHCRTGKDRALKATGFAVDNLPTLTIYATLSYINARARGRRAAGLRRGWESSRPF